MNIPVFSARGQVMRVSVLLVLAYLVTGKLALLLALPPGYVSAIFPPAGIAIAAVFLAGRTMLPAILFGSVLLNLWVGYSTHQQLQWLDAQIAVMIALASMLQAWAGGLCLQRLLSRPTTLDAPRDVIAFLLAAPVICLISATLAVSGLYLLNILDASALLNSWATWWIGDALGVIVMLPLMLILVGQPRTLWRKRVRTVAVPMLALFAVLVMAFITASKWERKESLVEFDSMAGQLAEQLRLRLETQEAVLAQISAVFTYHPSQVSRQDFHNFVKVTLDKFPMIYAIEWVPKVSHAERASFVQQMQQHHPGFDILEPGPNNTWRPAAEKPYYFPLTFIEPTSAEAQRVMGLDLTALAHRKATIEQAFAQHAAVASVPLQLYLHSGRESGLVLMYPVKGRDYEGVVQTVLVSKDFFGQLFTRTDGMLNIRLIETDSQALVYAASADPLNDVVFSRQFRFGSKRYQLDISPSAQYYATHRGWQSWTMLAVGMLCTGLVGAILLIGTGYTARVLAMVDEKTLALRASEKSFREIMEFAPIGMAIVSLEGRFTKVNQALCDIVGYPHAALMRLTFQQITHADDLEIDMEHVQQLLDGKLASYQMEKRYIRQDQSQVWVQLSVSLFRDEANVPQYFIAQIEDVNARKLEFEEVAQKAYFDALTGLPNRRMLLMRLHQIQLHIERYQQVAALIFLDVDHFKQINDTLGHDMGDLILKEVSQRLLGCLRQSDTVSRQGGDEFVMILPELKQRSDAEQVARKILHSFALPVQAGQHSIQVGVSIGVAVRDGTTQISVDDWMKQADRAMYQTKSAGRNSYTIIQV